MVTINQDSMIKEALSMIIESGHSRFPVYDPSTGDIIGILLAKDILKFSTNQEETIKISKIIRPCIFIPQSKRLNILLREFRINRNHIAIVLDEFGHIAGLVTIEDVLEQIVGEIADEYDFDEDDITIKKHADDTFIVKAKTSIDEFNHYFQAHLHDETLNKIGEIVTNHFSYLPKRGEIATFDGFQFKVLHSDNQRINLLEVKKIQNHH
jgi:magnesium and cobalt transporter